MTTSRTRLLLTALGAVAIAAALVACGGDDDNGDGDGSPTATATSSSNETTVDFSLVEYEINGPGSAPAGSIRFDVTNDGTMPHELVIIRSDAELDSLPIENSAVVEDDLDVIGEVEEFPADEERSSTFNLESGRYLLICNIPGHYTLGMVMEFTVE